MSESVEASKTFVPNPTSHGVILLSLKKNEPISVRASLISSERDLKRLMAALRSLSMGKSV